MSTMQSNSGSHLASLFFFSFSLFHGRGTGHGDRPQVPGMFVFGSSLVDNGNNHFLEGATSRADYFPYGIDSPPGVRGRYSNGKNVIDGLTDLLHLPPLPPFLDPSSKGHKIIHGVNFASGGSGILIDTGSTSGRVINMNQQITNFETVTLTDLSTKLNYSNRDSKDSLTLFPIWKYLFVIGVGGNDYMFNYFLRNSSKPTLEAFTSQLVIALSGEVQRLYTLGARKFVLISIYPFGCIPYVKDTEKGCLKPLNKVALLYNSKLRSLVDTLKQQMPGSKLVYVDSYQVIMDIINNPTPRGFKDTSNPCCKVSPKKDGGKGVRCDRGGYVCVDRRSHVFFDALHPTEAVNFLIANKAYSSNASNEVYPFNVQELVRL